MNRRKVTNVKLTKSEIDTIIIALTRIQKSSNYFYDVFQHIIDNLNTAKEEGEYYYDGEN
jgi:hypothetical protein